ncbi:hypothetical protein CPLU01_15543 [Colletotrichum plurivorum]|uniref:Uncharacterized protein n=1 Tax=Colletotrichum plurivorum TaxID=2175906 RepID=A0A8H6MU94_9PEZI|nr:hypothetical protein CPLU01_15543 [Colletotrichum plurivorum]
MLIAQCRPQPSRAPRPTGHSGRAPPSFPHSGRSGVIRPQQAADHLLRARPSGAPFDRRHRTIRVPDPHTPRPRRKTRRHSGRDRNVPARPRIAAAPPEMTSRQRYDTSIVVYTESMGFGQERQ